MPGEPFVLVTFREKTAFLIVNFKTVCLLKDRDIKIHLSNLLTLEKLVSIYFKVMSLAIFYLKILCFESKSSKDFVESYLNCKKGMKKKTRAPLIQLQSKSVELHTRQNSNSFLK